LPTLLTSAVADWMLNSYSKHTELTQEDVDWYFKQKELKRKKEKDKLKL
jgi:hypothetical protein